MIRLITLLFIPLFIASFCAAATSSSTTWNCGETQYMKLADGRWEIKIGNMEPTIEEPFIDESGITLFASLSIHEGFSVYITGFMDKKPKLELGAFNEPIPEEQIIFNNNAVGDMLNIEEDFMVSVEQWLPLHNWHRIAEYKEKESGQLGVYGFGPFNSDTIFGVCEKHSK